MGRFIKSFLTVALALTAATVLILGMQALAETNGAPKPGDFLLAQGAETKKEPAPCPAPPPKKPGQAKSMERPAPQMEKKSRKIEGSQQPPAAAGTKKFGGQTIRDKEAPDGD
jgi:hypothetical protein